MMTSRGTEIEAVYNRVGYWPFNKLRVLQLNNQVNPLKIRGTFDLVWFRLG